MNHFTFYAGILSTGVLVIKSDRIPNNALAVLAGVAGCAVVFIEITLAAIWEVYAAFAGIRITSIIDTRNYLAGTGPFGPHTGAVDVACIEICAHEVVVTACSHSGLFEGTGPVFSTSIDGTGIIVVAFSSFNAPIR